MGRLRRRLTQRQLGERVDLSASTIGALELGRGGGLSLDTWQRVAIALGQPLRLDLARDRLEETADAGHLAIQGLVLRLGNAAGWRADFELPSRPAEPWHSVDVAFRAPSLQVLVLAECWNTIGDIGAATRSTNRKVADLEAASVAFGAERRFQVTSCWIVRATRRNRQLVARYPHVFEARFPGSSRAWLSAITRGTPPPDEPGLIWADVAATRLHEWRRH